MRMFHFRDAKSHRFWSIAVNGSSLTVTSGEVGTAGQTQTETFLSSELAAIGANELIRTRLREGYIESQPAGTSPAEGLEQALLANPHDLGGWGIYADYLIEQGDPRGEFMQVQLGLEDESRSQADRANLKQREADLLKKYERDWLGPLAAVTLDGEPVPFWEGGKQVSRAPVAHRFARGWLSRLEFHCLTVAEARALACTPHARLLRELIVVGVQSQALVGSTQEYIHSYYEPGPDVPANIGPYGSPGLHALCHCPHLASVRIFQFGEGASLPDDMEEYFNCHTNGELVHEVVKQMPNLEELYLRAHRVDAAGIFALPMPNLRILLLYHSNSYPLDILAANESLTNLTTLLCHPHALEYDQEGAYIGLPHLQAIYRSPHLQSLTNLRLRLTDFGDSGVKEIMESGILKRLKVLDLEGGCITDEGANLLADCPDLKHLDFLNLRRNALTTDGALAITATGVKADVSEQHGEVPGQLGDGQIPEYLFGGDIE